MVYVSDLCTENRWIFCDCIILDISFDRAYPEYWDSMFVSSEKLNL